MREQIVIERRLLQLCIFFAAGVAVGAGMAGVLQGSRFLGLVGDVSADSNLRYFSGLLLGIGLAFWSTIPGIETHAARIRLLSFVVVCGGIARLAALITIGVPHGIMLFALANETLVPILVCLWQARVAKRFRRVVRHARPASS